MRYTTAELRKVDKLINVKLNYKIMKTKKVKKTKKIKKLIIGKNTCSTCGNYK